MSLEFDSDKYILDKFQKNKNAMIFDAEWEHIYESTDVSDAIFTSIAGSESKIKMMHSSEGIYLKDENATGFLKP